MASYAFRIVNVFAREGRLTGNPLCVFEDGRGLDDATQQALARQFNLSETTFILPSSSATARVRIYTPSYEMPFAGHPTLGTAHVVRALKGGDSIALEMKAGIIPVEARGDVWTLGANRPKWREAQEPREAIASAVGIEASDIAERPLWVSTGNEQLIIPVRGVDAVRRARPDAGALLALTCEDRQPKAYVFHDAGDANGTVESRFFFPSGAAILEDPATGSACANLGGWFCAMRPGARIERVVSQGEQVHRPSTLRLTVRDGSIFVGGRVIELARGTLEP